MIPLRLTLRNFMCYRENVPPLELEHVRLACLNGDNGAGKSTLLDAITWALWGKARVNADLDLMSIGAIEMQVEFVFRLGDQDYRVARRRTRKGAAAGWLDLFSRDGDDDTWRSFTGDTVRQTQARIIDLLKMDYETFINSALLLQGRADEFTTKPPARRKEVLGEILGLGIYDDLERRARERARGLVDQLRDLEAETLRLQAVAEREPAELAELERLSGAVIELDQEVERLTTMRQHLQTELTALQQEDQQRAALSARLDQAERQYQQVERLAAECQREITHHQTLLLRREEIEAGADRLTELQRHCTELDGTLRTVRALEAQRRTLEKVIDREMDRLRTEQHTLTHQITELGRVVGRRADLEDQRARLAGAATTATRLEAEVVACQQLELTTHGEIEALKTRNDLLRAEMQRLKDRQNQVDQADARCPLCRRPLSEHDKVHIHDEYQGEGVSLRTQFQANRTRIDELATLGQQHRQRIAELTHQTHRAHLEAREEARISEQLEQVREAEQALAAAQLRLTAVATRLHDRDFARAEQAELAELLAQLTQLAYDETAHEAARSLVAQLAHFADERAEVRRSALQLPREQAELALHTETLTHVGQQLAQTREEIVTLTRRVQVLPTLREQEQELGIRVSVVQRQRDTAQRDLGAAQSRLQTCQRARERLGSLEQERRRVTQEREHFGELVEAFGKKGIQAMVIETIVPELQDMANDLLDRMPGNTMRVEFQTQRDSRTGDTIETLDVIIKDEIGARKYELYSGGEAFRVNFAIRVALSKLLARRAGARLQLLVIDEGFGTQDSRGREGLLEAIRSIEDDFATILVITHLADIRDEFPTQIQVIKGTDGSTVSVA